MTAGAGYGNVVEFRDGLMGRRLSYVVSLNSTTGVWVGEVPAHPPERRFGRGRLRTRWVYDETAQPPSVQELAQQLPVTAWFSNRPPNTSLAEPLGLAKMRWRVELDYQQMKEELGLGQVEGRKWLGWERIQGEKRGSN